jgi:hypothetical protein
VLETLVGTYSSELWEPILFSELWDIRGCHGTRDMENTPRIPQYYKFTKIADLARKDHFKNDLRSDQDHLLKNDLRSDQNHIFSKK